jgi:hypothetical protein
MSGAAAEGGARAGARSRVAAVAVGVGLALLILLAGAAAVEGPRGLAAFVGRLHRPVAERSHTEYDPLLGWVNRASVRAADLYGPGRSLRTNAQRFRADRDYPAAAPAGKVRVVCSGDSFTLGYGVGDADPWCRRLEQLDPRIETVNMGQGGYGIDQAYLWYLRDGAALEQQVHLFCFTAPDFARMEQSTFLGYGKPVLRLRGETLEVGNTPVPRRGFWVPWLTENLAAFQELRAARLLRGLFGGREAPGGDAVAGTPGFELALAVFEKLRALHRARGSELLLVYLPSTWDDPAPAHVVELRERLARELGARGFAFVDLADALYRLPPELRSDLYFPRDTPFQGHYTPKGNDVVARLLLRDLPRR